jgi:hypothetical protein
MAVDSKQPHQAAIEVVLSDRSRERAVGAFEAEVEARFSSGATIEELEDRGLGVVANQRTIRLPRNEMVGRAALSRSYKSLMGTDFV